MSCVFTLDLISSGTRMMEHGLLGLEAAKKAMERKKKSQFAQKLGLPTKTSKYIIQKTEKIIPKTPSQRSNSISNGSNKPLLNVKRKSGHDSDDDLILKPKKKVNMSTWCNPSYIIHLWYDIRTLTVKSWRIRNLAYADIFIYRLEDPFSIPYLKLRTWKEICHLYDHINKWNICRNIDGQLLLLRTFQM